MEIFSDWMNITDGCVLVLLGLGLIGGIRRGLSGELLRIASIILAFVAGWRGTEPLTHYLEDLTGRTPAELKPAAFIGLVVISYLALSILRRALRLMVDFSFKGQLEVMGGAVTGLVRAGFFASLVLLGASLIPHEPLREAVRHSITGQWVNAHVRPRFDDLVARNPEFQLPELIDPESNGPSFGLDTPALEPYLGPLIEPGRDDGE